MEETMILVLMVFAMEIKFGSIFTIIFVISASKYVSVRSLKKIRGPTLSVVQPKNI